MAAHDRTRLIGRLDPFAPGGSKASDFPVADVIPRNVPIRPARQCLGDVGDAGCRRIRQPREWKATLRVAGLGRGSASPLRCVCGRKPLKHWKVLHVQGLQRRSHRIGRRGDYRVSQPDSMGFSVIPANESGCPGNFQAHRDDLEPIKELRQNTLLVTISFSADPLVYLGNCYRR